MSFFVTLALFAVSLILSEVLRPKPDVENARPATLGDFQFPTATEGRVIPLVWGTVKLNGPNVVWYGDLRQRAITEKVKTGLFSSSTITKGYRYDLGLQLSLCRGEVDELLRVWVGDDVVFTGNITDGQTFTIDEPNLFGGDDLGNGGIVGTMRFYSGNETQMPSSYLSTFQQEGGDTPGYRGTCYLAPENAPVYVGNSTSIRPWSFEVRRLPVGPSMDTRAVNGDADANPAFVLYEILTNDEWGLSFAPADIDGTSFNEAADTLRSEGNGFSFVLDRTRSIEELTEEVQRQIDGVVFLDQQTGLWTIRLARADSTNLGNVTEANILEVQNFSRGSWEDTANFITTPFTDRSRDYFDTFGLAQDMANQRIQQAVVKTSVAFPGVKDATLSNQLAWRELRTQAIPLAKATLIVNREFWNARPTDLVTWTSAALGINNLVMRIGRVDLGQIDEGRIALEVVQDVFSTVTPSFGDPIPTGWTPPLNVPVVFPADEQLAFEAPRAFGIRDIDPASVGLPYRIWAAARNQNDGAAEFDIRTATGATFETERTVPLFMLIGQLTAAIDPDTISGSIEITPTPDGQNAWLNAIIDTPQDTLGNDLTNLILIGDEFMLVSNAGVINVSNVQLQNIYRGVLDSSPKSHGMGENVYLLSAGGGIGNRSFDNGNTVNTRLISRTIDQELSEGAPGLNTIVTVMNNRHLRPYPPTALNPNNLGDYSTANVSLNATGSGDTIAMFLNFFRRDYTEFQENSRQISGDAAPSNTTTVYRVRVFDTSSGDVELFATDFNAGTNQVLVERVSILRGTGGVIPTSLRLEVETRHTVDTVDYDGLQASPIDINTVDSELSPDFNLGVLAASVVSSAWSAPTTGSYNCTVGTASTGTIEVQINGGGFNTVIAANNTTGSFMATAGDTVEFRSVSTNFSGVRDETLMVVDSPSSTTDAYAVFTD